MTAVTVIDTLADMAEFTMREISERSGVPPRTIRYYQSIGLLPKPARNGKEAVYRAAHLERLQLIAEMRERRMKLDAIAELLNSDVHTRNSAADWLGLDALRIDSGERICTDAELTELLGDRRAEILDDLIAERYLEFTDGLWHIPDFPLFHAALELYDTGTSVAVSASLRDLLRKRIAALADELVAVISTAAGDGYAGEGTSEDLARNLDRFRPIARESAGHVLAQEVTRAVATRDQQAALGLK